MIYDKIENYETYAGLSEGIREGLEYLAKMNADTPVGVYEISPRARAIVSEYTTKPENPKGFEAHREYIDIQYLLAGEEQIACQPLEYLEETTPYNGEKDILFLADRGLLPCQNLPIGNGLFAILFPQDGHKPCLCLHEPASVKKVVVKVKMQ